MTREKIFCAGLLPLVWAFSVVADPGFRNPEAEMAALYLRMEVAGRVAAEAAKLSEGDETAAKQIAEAVSVFKSGVTGEVRRRLTALYPDEATARTEYGNFVNRLTNAASGNDTVALQELAEKLEIRPWPASFSELSAAIIKRDLSEDVDAAGKFLGDVQSWVRMKGKDGMPSLRVWLDRDKRVGVKPKKKSRSNSLRDAEADAGTFVEARDDGESSLRSFSSQRKARRKKVMEEAQRGMEQVATERRIADDEASARKLAAAQAEAAAMQAQAQRLADAEQQAIVQDQNSWKTRIKGVVSTAIGAAGAAFAGSAGARVGEAAADAILGNTL